MRKGALIVSIVLMCLAIPERVLGQWRDTLDLKSDMAQIAAEFGNPQMNWRLIGPDGEVMGDPANQNSSSKRRVGSLGKVIVAVGIMKLVEDGLLDLEDPIRTYLPDMPLENPWEGTDPVRIVHLLEHSSGLDDMHFNEYFAYGQDFTLAQALARNPHSKRIRWRPGTCSAYSNVGYAIAARIIEVVTGQPLETWLRKAILGPLKMEDTYFSLPQAGDAVDPEILPGANSWGEVRYQPYLYYPAVGLVSTADDLTRLIRLFMGYGKVDGLQILDSASVARMMQHQSTPASKSQWMQGQRSLGFGLWGPTYDPALRASGFVSGNIAQMCLLPNHDYGWLVLSNATAHDAAYIAAFSARLDRTLPNHRWLPQKTLSQEASSAPPTGHYRYVSRRNELFAFYDDLSAGLDLEPAQGNPSYICHPWSGNSFSLTVLGNGYADWEEAQGDLALAGKSAEGKDFLLVGEKYYEFTTSPWPAILRTGFMGYRWAVYLGILMLVVTLIGRIKGKSFAVGSMSTGIWANLPFWCAMLGFQILQSDFVYELGKMSLLSVSLLGISLLLPIASLAAAWSFVKWKAVGHARWWKWLHLPLVLGNLGLAAYLAIYGVLPFCSWLY